MDVHEDLDFAVVETPHPHLVLDRARADEGVRYAHHVQTFELGHVPDDPRFPVQYGLEQVRAPAVWDTSRGRVTKSVCVVDTGARLTHEDLPEARILAARDFVDGELPPEDARSHGTHVAGIAAASVDNGKGVAGVGNLGLLVARTFGAEGGAPGPTSAAAIHWCVENGADVVSMSWGSQRPSGPVQDAVEYAHERDRLLVAAAMNDGCRECIRWPARNPRVVAVTCTDADRDVCDFSNTGEDAELAAPGNAILSLTSHGDDTYGNDTGTSMSAPYVSGVAALTWSIVPELSGDELRELLQSTADDEGAPGRDARYGFGIVNASSAVDAALDRIGNDVCLVAEPRPSVALAGDASVTVRASAPEGLDRVSLFLEDERVDVHRGELPSGEVTLDVPTRHLADERHDLDVRCTDASGTERTVETLHPTENLDASLVAPSDGSTVSGEVQVEIGASSTRGDVEAGYVSVDGGPWINVTENATSSGFTFGWNTTTHDNEAEPATVETRVRDEGGFEHETPPTRVVVDNKVDPTVEILQPASNATVVAREHVIVRAAEASQDGFRVEVRPNDRAWVDITQNRTGDRYHWNWTTTGPQQATTLHARATSENGVTHDRVNVTVRGSGTVVSLVDSVPCRETLLVLIQMVPGYDCPGVVDDVV